MGSFSGPLYKRDWCANEHAVAQVKTQNDELTESVVLHGGAWCKETCKLINSCNTVCEIDDVLDRPWQESSHRFPPKLQAALREGLEAP